MILLIDNFDSFTYNLVQYLQELGEEVTVIRSDQLASAPPRTDALELVVLSPGPGNPAAARDCIQYLDAIGPDVPVLGVCLGMQIIAHYFGANVVRAKEPVHGKVQPVFHDGTGLFSGLPSPMKVTRYHSLVVEAASLPDCLQVTARSDGGEIMGLQHRSRSLCGVQFHPEALLTEYGHDLLRNALPIKR